MKFSQLLREVFLGYEFDRNGKRIHTLRRVEYINGLPVVKSSYKVKEGEWDKVIYEEFYYSKGRKPCVAWVG